MINGYQNSLVGFLKIRWMAWVLVIAFGGIIYALFKISGHSAGVGTTRRPGGFRIQATAPEGATFEYMLDYTDKIGTYLRKTYDTKDVAGVIAITSPSFGSGATNSAAFRIVLGDRPAPGSITPATALLMTLRRKSSSFPVRGHW